MPFATVIIKGTKNAVAAQADGTFSITPTSDWEKITLVFSSVGFEVKEMLVERKTYLSSLNIVLAELKAFLSGEVVIVGAVGVKRKPFKPFPIIQRIFKDTAFNFFKVFPNPVNNGTIVHLEWKQKSTSDFMLQLLNVSGQLIYTKQTWIDDEARLLEFQLPSVVPGNYFIRMTNKKSGKSYTEKIIIN